MRAMPKHDSMFYGRILPQHDKAFVDKHGGWKGYIEFLRVNDIAAPCYKYNKKTNVTSFVGLRMINLPQARSSKRVGRNDPCSCGSGKKYKKCCMNMKEE